MSFDDIKPKIICIYIDDRSIIAFMTTTNVKPRRGRPPKAATDNRDIRALLIRSGLEHLTEIGFVGSGIDKVLKKVGVPKGSFYFYFASKEAFGHAVLDSYANYFANKLSRCLLDTTCSPLVRLANFVDDAKQGMEKHNFRRGCLVGNLEQEVGSLPESFRSRLIEIYTTWQNTVATCLEEAQSCGELAESANCQYLAEFFWLGWEGAVSRAKLEANTRPLEHYFQQFVQGLPK